jgi:HTH-type transcriptional regulator / antitoxin HigA
MTEPRWASAPGRTVFALMQERGLSEEQLADSLAISDPAFRRLLRGELSLDPQLASQLTSLLGGSTAFWLERQRQYDQSRLLVSAAEVSDRAPRSDMRAFGWVEPEDDWVDGAEKLLGYFGVHDADEWNERWAGLFERAHFRASDAFEADPVSVAVWLRQLELQAERTVVAEWSPLVLRAKIPELRRLTKVADPVIFYGRAANLLAEAGVAFLLVRPPSGCTLSGAAFVDSSGRRIIGATARHRVDDHFWFTLFHEIGHLLLHDATEPFLDILDGGHQHAGIEAEADSFASEALAPNLFPWSGSRPTLRTIVALASGLGIAPGIVLGQFQHQGLVPYESLNRLKRRYRWDGSTLRT